MKRDMSTSAALKEARKRWGANVQLRADKRVNADGKWFTVGHRALGGLFFMSKGEGPSWREAFANADAREAKDHERIVTLVADTASEKKS